MSLSGRRALLTGACGSLGLVIADTLAELGADLILVDRPEADFERSLAMLAQRWSVTPQTLSCDLESEEQRAGLIAHVLRSSASLDILVNNAAFVGSCNLQGWSTALAEQSVATWRRALEVNLTAAFDLSKQFTEALVASGSGSIVNIGSIYGHLGPDWAMYADTDMANPAAYAASKGGLLQLTRWMATTMAPHIRVNSLSPGGIERGQPEAFRKRYAERTPLGRMAHEDDFRGAVAYLTSDLSRYVTGQDLRVDGGWSAW